MERLEFNQNYKTRFEDAIDLSNLNSRETEIIKQAIHLHNQNVKVMEFLDWMCELPEIQRFLYCGVWLTEEGKKSALYQVCDDLLYRLARNRGIVGNLYWQKPELQ